MTCFRLFDHASFQFAYSAIPSAFCNVMDNIMDSFAALKIQPTNQSRIIKQAYYKVLQTLLADTSSNNFITLRRCYIQALRNSRRTVDASSTLKHAPLNSTKHAQVAATHSTKNPSSEKLTISDLRHALYLQPYNPFILIEISKYYIEINKYRLAIDILESILDLSPRHTEAKLLLLKTEHAWCLRLAKRFKKLSSEDIEYLIRHKMSNSQYREALTYLEKAISTRLTDLHAPTLFRLSAECMASQRIDTASHYFEKALEQTHDLNENPSTTLLAYIEYLFAFKQFDMLLLLIDDLIKLDPNQHRYHYLKGESLRQIKHYRQSITCLRYAIGLSPNKAKYYDRIAHAYRESGHIEKAGKYAQVSSDINKQVQLDEYL